MSRAQEYEVRDKRRKGWFDIDNEVIFVYGEKIGHHGIAVYAALCCLAREDGRANPGLSWLCEKLRMGRAKLLSTLALLEEVGLIAIDSGDRANTSVYTLLHVEKAGSDENQRGSSENQPKGLGGSNENQCGSNENQLGGSNENRNKTKDLKTNKTERGEAIVQEDNVTHLDDVTRSCTSLLMKVKRWPYSKARTGEVVRELREKYPGADALKVCDEYEYGVRHGAKVENHALKLRTYFRKAEEWAGEKRGVSEEPRRPKKRVI